MLVTFEKIEDISYGLVQYYTVRFGNNELTEFELFDEKAFNNHEEEIQILYNVINLMQETGARKHYFKFEGSAGALPIVPAALMDANKEDFGVRLYCKMVNESIVVLFNGDIKTVKGGADTCPRVRDHFKRAVKISILIDRAIYTTGDIDLSETDPFKDFEIDI